MHSSRSSRWTGACYRGEVIPHEERVFSVFEEHTRRPVPAASQDDVEGQRCGRDGADDLGDAGAVSGAAGVQFRPGISQSGEPGGTGPIAGAERVTGQGEVEQGASGGGTGIPGGAAAAPGGGIGDQPPRAPRSGSGGESGSGRLRADGDAVGAGSEHPSAGADSAGGGAQEVAPTGRGPSGLKQCKGTSPQPGRVWQGELCRHCLAGHEKRS